LLSNRHGPQWILEGDIKACFDRISHPWLLTHVPMDTRLLRQWLEAGFLEKHAWFATTEGTPQGGIITPPTLLQKPPSSPTLSSPERGSDRSMGKDGSPGSIPVQGRLRAAVSERRSPHDDIPTEVLPQPSHHSLFRVHPVSEAVDRVGIPGFDPGRRPPPSTAAITIPCPRAGHHHPGTPIPGQGSLTSHAQ
jgi:hypothetical protein